MVHPVEPVEYEPVIGLEVHCQLLTESKAFSPDSAAFGGAPNTHVDPISLGHPGTLPVLNARMVEYTLRMGLATHCRIASRSELARKHYFYPDLPKGYQISQYETPLCADGYIDIPSTDASDEAPEGVRRIGIVRIHIEEDAGKSIHDQDPYQTLLDFNRCGVPLIEIVSAPDLQTPREAYHYLQKIRQIVRYLGICDGNMEEGSLRCDANVSVRPRGALTLGTKTEVKNMNSFRHVEQALEYEIRRQIRVLRQGGTIEQQTMLWDVRAQETRPMRTKERAHDYRYFPDPDLVPICVDTERLDGVRRELPEMPWERRARYVDTYGLPAYDASVLTEERPLSDYFEQTLAALEAGGGSEPVDVLAKAASNIVMTDVLRVLNEEKSDPAAFPIRPDRLAGLVRLRLSDTVSSSGAQALFNAMLTDDAAPPLLAERLNLVQVSDDGALVPVVKSILDTHPKQVAMYLNGKESLIGFFVGQVMRTFEGSPDPKRVKEILKDRLETLRN